MDKTGNFVENSDDQDSSSSEDDGSESRGSKDSVIDGEDGTYVLELEDFDDEATEVDPNQLVFDKEWLAEFISEKLKRAITQVEGEVDNIRNKKIRGTSKKQKDMLKTLNEKLKLMRATREKCEELAMTMEFLDGGAIRTLKVHLRKYSEDYDSETLRTAVENEVARLIELADHNRTHEDTTAKEPEEECKQSEQESESQYGHLSWLHRQIDLTSEENADVWLEKSLVAENLREGLIVDAQDSYFEWHLAIVIKLDTSNDAEYVKCNFLRYPKGNRDEWYPRAEIADRISGPFANVKVERDEQASRSLNALRDYYRK